MNQKLGCKWRSKTKAEKVASPGPPAPAPMPEARVDLTHAFESESEIDTRLPSSTIPLRLEDPSDVKRTRGVTLDFVALHTRPARKETRPWE